MLRCGDKVLSTQIFVQGPVGKMLFSMGRHNMRPSHLHLMVEAPSFRKLVTAVYLAGDEWIASDVVFGPKKSLIVVRRM